MTCKHMMMAMAMVLVATSGIQAAPIVVNKSTPLAGGFVVDGPHVLSQLAEDGLIDLDGNGSLVDDVLHIHHRPTKTTYNLQLPASATVRPALFGNLIAFAMPEASVGVGDLNGDGDTLDEVVHLHNHVTGLTTNVGVATPTTSSLHLEGNVLLFDASEVDEGLSLNGDTDTNDAVLHIFKDGWAVARNLGYTVTGLLPREVQFDRDSVLWTANELRNNVDLNADGDTLDDILFTHDIATAVTTNLGLSGDLADWISSSSVSVDQLRYRASDVVFLASEANSAATVLNGDGDTLDEVMHVVDTKTAGMLNLGYTASLPSATRTDGTMVAFNCSESSQGADLNGDGDQVDALLATHDLTTGTTTVTAHKIHVDWQQGDVVIGSRSESSVGTDLNGDGDLFDYVGTHWNRATDTTINLGINTSPLPFTVLGSHYYVLVDEASAVADLNGDQDTSDQVLHHVNIQTGAVTNLGLATTRGSGLAHARDDRIAVMVSEADQGNVDRNGDGDTLDETVVVINVLTNTAYDTQRAVSSPYRFALHNERLYQQVDEASDGQDLNGDGDTLDHILHVFRW